MTARSLEPSTPRGEATRQRVLEAAEHVFGEKGYHGASVTEITRAAGVAQGTFYLYFRGKKEIFLDLVDSIGNRLLQSTLRASPSGSNFVPAQRDGFRTFFAFAGHHRHIYRIIQECDRVDPITYRRFYTMLAEAYARRAGDAMEPVRSLAATPRCWPTACSASATSSPCATCSGTRASRTGRRGGGELRPGRPASRREGLVSAFRPALIRLDLFGAL